MNDRNSVIRRSFAHRFGGAPDLIARAPGRVNLIGEHTDYNDGFVLPLAINYDVRIAARGRSDRQVRLYSADLGEWDTFSLDHIGRVGATVGWADYVRGVAQVLQGEGHVLWGMDAVFSGNVPMGAGLSSSAALELATITALRRLNTLDLDPVWGALLCQRAENEFVGVRCGIMDQFVSSLGRTGHALLIDCRGRQYSAVLLPDFVRVVVVDSGVRRKLAGSAYNERRAQCETGARLMGVSALRDVSLQMLAELEDKLPGIVARRCRHVVTENQRVLHGVAALERGDAVRFGDLMNASHASMRDLFEISTPEIETLVEIQRANPGCLGVRLTGAGFGGCTVALVQSNAVSPLEAAIQAEYPERTGKVPQVYVCDATDGAGLVNDGLSDW